MIVAGLAIAYFALQNRQGQAPSAEVKRGLIESSPPKGDAGQIYIPVGNSMAPREQLYSFAFDDHFTAVKTLLAAARSGNFADFDQSAAWLRANKPTRSWPRGESKARRAFNEHIDVLVNTARASNNTTALESAVRLSEQFLQVHFGHSTAHLNLAIAQVALGQAKSALAPAFHAIVFNPDSANGYVALGVALARTGDTDGATDAFCSVLRKVKYSGKTVAFFEKIANGEEFKYPEVTRAMLDTAIRCPKERWGVDYPTTS